MNPGQVGINLFSSFPSSLSKGNYCQDAPAVGKYLSLLAARLCSGMKDHYIFVYFIQPGYRGPGLIAARVSAGCQSYTYTGIFIPFWSDGLQAAIDYTQYNIQQV